MYSDLFDQLGARRGGGGVDGGDSVPNNDPPPKVQCKAGKMQLTAIPDTHPVRYRCEPDSTRGEIRLVYQPRDRMLEWQWYNRREEKVVDVFPIPADNAGLSTWERVELEDAYANGLQRQKDRLYVWTRPGSTEQPDEPAYEMYWMQDASPEQDETVCAAINQYLADPASAAPTPTMATRHQQQQQQQMHAASSSSSSSSSDTQASAMGNATSGRTGGAGGGAAADASQVDALSSILENLGMPQAGSGATGGATSGTLTLQDLQGAMASMQQQQQQQAPGLALSDVVTPAAVTALLENPDVSSRLLELLPPGQRSLEHLEDNLRSPQVQQTLRSLTLALLPDEDSVASAGEDTAWSGFYSVMANFQLDPADAQEAIAAQNPIQAFLDALLQSVERESDADNKTTEQEEKMGDDDDDKPAE